MKEVKMADINSHEYTLQALKALAYVWEKQQKAIKKINFNSKLRFGIGLIAIYYVYDNLNQKIKLLENKQKDSESVIKENKEPEE